MTYDNFVAIIIPFLTILYDAYVPVSVCVHKTMFREGLGFILSSVQVEKIENPPRTHDWLYIPPCRKNVDC